ncbi:hypothetical protein [Spirosoma flavum]|uniref:Uncharacterized protein n=1 Tax=Spirosoma flavum TaxID=2048557 RepID=A0ABW6AIZ2_9BACT
MFLIFTTIDSENQLRDFSWWFSSLEIALEVLSSVALRGKQIIKAEILDNDQRINLSPEAFDGSTMSSSIQQLESEWQQILSEPVNLRSVHNEWLVALVRKRIRDNEAHIAQLELAIKTTEQNCRRIRNSICDKRCPSKQLKELEVLLNQYKQYLFNAQTRQKKILDQLIQMQTQ